MENFDLKFFLTVAHLIGVAIGMGGAFFGDYLFFKATENGIISKPEWKGLQIAGKFAWTGLAILFLSGLAMFFLNPAKYMASTKFISKMAIVLVIALNGVVFHGVHFKTIKKLLGVELRHSILFKNNSRGMFASGAISTTSWLSALALGSLGSLPFSIVQILGFYFVVLIVAVLISQLVRARFLKHK